MSRYYDRAGAPISMQEWGRLFVPEYQIVRATIVTDSAAPPGTCTFEISTVWIGLDHRWGDGPPLIFETMIFAPDGHVLDHECRRYSTEDEAQIGHAEMEQIAACACANPVMTRHATGCAPAESAEPAVTVIGSRCPHCGGDWHGLPITLRMAQIRQLWQSTIQYYEDGPRASTEAVAALDAYRYNTDDSPVICPGSSTINRGPDIDLKENT